MLLEKSQLAESRHLTFAAHRHDLVHIEGEAFTPVPLGFTKSDVLPKLLQLLRLGLFLRFQEAEAMLIYFFFGLVRARSDLRLQKRFESFW